MELRHGGPRRAGWNEDSVPVETADARETGFGHRGHVGHVRESLLGRDGKCFDLTRANCTDVRGDVRFGDMYVAAEHCGQRFTRTARWKMHHLHTRCGCQCEHIEVRIRTE